MLKALGQVLFTGLQGPKYTTAESKGKDYEIRTYEAATWVSVTLKGTQGDAVMKEGFGKLFKYIQGENDKKVKMDMTAPVTGRVEPSADPASESSFTVSFFIPQEHQADPPTPSSPDVVIENRPEITVFVRTYGGFTNDQTVRAEHLKLVESLRRDGVQFCEEPFYRVGYDPPFKLTNRRNEVWLLQSGRA
ncbi:heme-binding protein 2-like [Alosa sapidissima]|uniref:heme-binding protein 2-like n=1 Tax=Alosa sapidissima TaxID=34773 RepID=UPI001C0A152D|nr:heme-binding protein 2-like [Alosa sapidissima]XP_041951075.1 heme-binding protein 2-like [Alosa sapidissima]XP_041951076.1 heme-binding protein 2-like [Alosa sapidissima]XP_041951077.1 heme-binding protein 2-like [Alosa sapidissima]